MAAHFEDGAAAGMAAFGIAEAGIEEAGIMNAELAHCRIDRHHLGGKVGRNMQLLLRGENVEFVGIEDQPLVGARVDRSQKSATS